MTNLSRRQLAVYGADQLLAKKNPKVIARELAAVLIASRRQAQAGLLADDIAWELERRGQVANALVTSAQALGESLRRQISSHVKSAAKVKDVIINENIDKSVIGGIRIDTAVHSWDKTLSRKLAEIREVV